MISRRSALKTAAWSAPVITLATAAPAFASSPQPPQPPLCKPKGCRVCSGWGKKRIYTYQVRVDCGKDKITSVLINGQVATKHYSQGYWFITSKIKYSSLPVAITVHNNPTPWTGAVAFG